MVLLPIYADSAGAPPVVWGSANPWREAFLNLESADGLVPLILPAGDAQDAQLRPEQINARDTTALNDFAARYEANGVIIAKATGGVAGPDVQITLTEVRGVAEPTDTVLTSPAPVGQDRAANLAAAAAVAVDAVSDAWKRQSRVEVKRMVQLTALATVSDIREWVKIRDGLRNVALVDRVELQAITRDRAQLTLRYGGDPARLPQAFAQQGVIAVEDGGVWMLSLPRQSAPVLTQPH